MSRPCAAGPDAAGTAYWDLAFRPRPRRSPLGTRCCDRLAQPPGPLDTSKWSKPEEKQLARKNAPRASGGEPFFARLLLLETLCAPRERDDRTQRMLTTAGRRVRPLVGVDGCPERVPS
jgi:hypothetical protein